MMVMMSIDYPCTNCGYYKKEKCTWTGSACVEFYEWYYSDNKN